MIQYLTPKQGSRKYTLGVIYLGCCTALDWFAIGQVGTFTLANLAGLASLNGSLATGLAVIVWGNVQEHRAAKGNGG